MDRRNARKTEKEKINLIKFKASKNLKKFSKTVYLLEALEKIG